MRSDKVILGSVLSEKSVALSLSKVYTLKVDCRASKDDVRVALRDVFGVDAVEVNTLVTRGKTKRRARAKKSGMVTVKRSNVKKAIVRLRDGQELPTMEQALPVEA